MTTRCMSVAEYTAWYNSHPWYWRLYQRLRWGLASNETQARVLEKMLDNDPHAPGVT
jgi:hypothetical protein